MNVRVALFAPLAIALAACSSASSDSGSPPVHGGGGAPPASASDGDGGASEGGQPATSQVQVTDDADHVRIATTLLTIEIDKHTGLASYTFGGERIVGGAYASVDLGPSGYLTSKSYEAHALRPNVTQLQDTRGLGKRVEIESTSAGKPTIVQIFSVYDTQPFFFVDEHVENPTSLSSNYLGAIIVDEASGGSVTPGPGPDPRVLDVPFDNDEWVRFDSRVLGNADFTGTGYELGAVYESQSRHGLVVGSVTHDFWKTGFYYSATQGHLRAMNVWGGAATPDQADPSGPTYGKDGTHDVAKHGAMSGTTLASPTIFVGYFDDYRNGLEQFGRANAVVAPPKPWNKGVPFGWLSWGAFGLGVTAQKIQATSDFLSTNLQNHDFAGGAGVYVNIDAGLNTDPTPLVAYVHQKGQKAGTYRAPFSYFYNASDPSPLGKTASGSYTYADVVLKDDANQPIKHNGAYVLDVTHPGTIAMMKGQIDSVKQAGFDYLKLDFLTNGAFEGKHYDPNVKTGIQAYNQAMKYLNDLIGPDIFVSLSIAPIFPSQYGHARRISCDVVGQLNDLESPTYPHYGSTEYMLNALTFGWWMNGTIYTFNDPDAMALLKFEGKGNVFPDAWAETRVTASTIAGTVFLDSTDYSDSTGAARATALLTNPRINALARRGTAFRPVEGNTGRVNATISGSTATSSGSQATDVFVLQDSGATYLALFNYDQTNASTKSVSLARAGMSGTASFAVTDEWSGAAAGKASGTLSVSLAPGEAKLLKLVQE